jgi:hypothetical protein
MQARMRARGIRFDKEADWFQNFHDELVRFPRDKHDDQVDAFAYLGLILNKMVEAPTKQEIIDDEYDTELRTSGLYELGRTPTPDTETPQQPTGPDLARQALRTDQHCGKA